MTLKKIGVGQRFAVLLCNAFFIPAGMADEGVSSGVQPYPKDLLQQVRHAATLVPGDMAVAINFAKVAESHRKYSAIIEGGGDELFISARTAFQIRYPHGSVMLDSGMDEEVHRYYGFGRDEPYWQDVNDDVQAALRSAALIVVTHEHGDHVAGVIRSEYRGELVSKTILTKAQAHTLVNSPQIPQLGITTDQAHDYKVVDYELLLPVAPGMVLLKSPGHTAGHQMVYVQLADGTEYLFIGDIGWSLDNIHKLRLRPAATISRIGEDPQALLQQMSWIKQVMDEDGLIVVPSHDNRLLEQYAEDGLVGTSLQLTD